MVQELPALQFISAEDGRTACVGDAPFCFDGILLETRTDGSAALWLGTARPVSPLAPRACVPGACSLVGRVGVTW